MGSENSTKFVPKDADAETKDADQSPDTWSSSLLLNMSFALCYFLCGYFYVQAMILDPGYIPKSGSRGQQKAVIEELLSKRAFNEQHFCSSCMIRKPLRSKHCRKCNRCVAREDQ